MNILLLNGHGGNPYDPGATGNGQTEAVLTRELADMVVERLKKYANVYRYPKGRDAFADVQNGTFAKNMPLSFKNTHYAFEIHFNAFRKDEVKDGRKKGTECYVTSREAGITVEQEIMKNLSKYFPLRDNDNIFDGVKRTNFLVINTLKNNGISGALLETCFIDDADDMDTYLKNKGAIADAIVNGIVAGFGLGQANTKPPVKPTQPQKKQTLYLPADAASWRVYPLGIAPVIGNEKGFLYPSKFGGLQYEVLGYPQANVVTIKTRDYGTVNIYVGKETGAVIK